MATETNDFFHQATMRICSSLDINTVMQNSLDYLANFIPLTGITMVFGEPGLPAVHAVAQVARYKFERFGRITPLPKKLRKTFEREWTNLQNVVIVNDPETDMICRTMTKLAGRPDMSVMHMRLKIHDKERLFALVAFVMGKNQYKEEHARLLSMLHDPFAIAMANALKHEEILKLKEMLTDDNRYLHQELLRLTGDEIIGRDQGLKEVFKTIRQVAALDSPILLLGETGVGKEAIANAIHYSSPRRNGPFIKVNCGAIPEALIDSELFGHEKGAFTGALAQKRGRFERAHKGTILLDEIGELSSSAQVRLLRVLQNKEIERVGGSEPIPLDIRIIAATHRNLESMISSNRFREDLWFRLNVLPINIPPLRNRKEDIEELVYYFIKRKSTGLNMPQPPGVEENTIRLLKEYNWPGNVRELENIVERALIQYHGQNMTGPMAIDDLFIKKAEHGHPKIQAFEHETSDLERIVSMHVKQTLRHALENIALLQTEYETLYSNGKAQGAGRVDDIIATQLSRLFKQPLGKSVLAGNNSQQPMSANNNGIMELDKINSLHIQKVLKLTNGKIHGPGGAAELLGLNPSTLRNRMVKLGINSKNK